MKKLRIKIKILSGISVILSVPFLIFSLIVYADFKLRGGEDHIQILPMGFIYDVELTNGFIYGYIFLSVSTVISITFLTKFCVELYRMKNNSTIPTD